MCSSLVFQNNQLENTHLHTHGVESRERVDGIHGTINKANGSVETVKVKTLYILIDQLDSRRLLDKDALRGVSQYIGVEAEAEADRLHSFYSHRH